MTGYIYIITNDINNKVYIGQTVTTLRNRWNQHVSKSKRSNSYFYKAVREIGIEHFKMNLLEQCNADELNDKERYYISKYDSYNNGYNSTLGGFGTHKYELDEDSVIEMYKTLGIESISKKYGCNKSVIRSILVKNNIALRDANNESKSIVILDSYNVLYIFESIKSAWRWLVENYRDNMKASEAHYYINRACLYGNTAFGYKWMYMSDIDINNYNSIVDNYNIQKLRKNNEKLHKKEVKHRRIESYNGSGRPGLKCSITINDDTKNFESIKDLAEYISILEHNHIADDKKLRDKAYNIKKAIDKGRKYKGLDIKIFNKD